VAEFRRRPGGETVELFANWQKPRQRKGKKLRGRKTARTLPLDPLPGSIEPLGEFLEWSKRAREAWEKKEKK
jgi:hypothetical protein